MVGDWDHYWPLGLELLGHRTLDSLRIAPSSMLLERLVSEAGDLCAGVCLLGRKQEAVL